jgi:hypothetical protein
MGTRCRSLAALSHAWISALPALTHPPRQGPPLHVDALDAGARTGLGLAQRCQCGQAAGRAARRHAHIPAGLSRGHVRLSLRARVRGADSEPTAPWHRYAWHLHPTCVPPGYHSWISARGGLDQRIVTGVREIVFGRTPDMASWCR